VAELSKDSIESFRSVILEHYRTAGRRFPWRETRNPYHILVSEMMLQQTQTDRVVPKYLEWLSVFPTPESLAETPFSEVLDHWVGLGYNRRARFLQETCKAITHDYGGLFPETPELLVKLPGIGPYTASAVSTFAFGKANAFIETNIRAVYIFFFFPEREAVSDAEIMKLVEQTVDGSDPRSWYYALMDYGAVLKKTVKNPNRKSSHYSKQSRFEGSVRQARGAIVRALGEGHKATLAEIAAESSIEYERLEIAAGKLVAEGLIAENDGRYGISG
jgi:A/G-specific adenine glycosylase